jgi:hypothetical protein
MFLNLSDFLLFLEEKKIEYNLIDGFLSFLNVKLYVKAKVVYVPQTTNKYPFLN